jgi:hypothetical protein
MGISGGQNFRENKQIIVIKNNHIHLTGAFSGRFFILAHHHGVTHEA